MANGSGYKALCAAVADAIQLGSNSGLRVSELCLGTMNFGQPGRGHQGDWTLGPDAARPIFKAALDQGLFYFDCADVYGVGACEEVVGALLRDLLPRDEYVFATKVAMPMSRGANQGGLSRKHITEGVDASLRRTGLDYIDHLVIHRHPHGVPGHVETPIEESLEALHDVVKAGKVLYLGASSMFAWQFTELQMTAAANGWTKFISMQRIRDATSAPWPARRLARARQRLRPRPSHAALRGCGRLPAFRLGLRWKPAEAWDVAYFYDQMEQELTDTVMIVPTQREALGSVFDTFIISLAVSQRKALLSRGASVSRASGTRTTWSVMSRPAPTATPSAAPSASATSIRPGRQTRRRGASASRWPGTAFRRRFRQGRCTIPETDASAADAGPDRQGPL